MYLYGGRTIKNKATGLRVRITDHAARRWEQRHGGVLRVAFYRATPTPDGLVHGDALFVVEKSGRKSVLVTVLTTEPIPSGPRT